ncbi:hypothetical protein RYX36_020786 [Vicia faba]
MRSVVYPVELQCLNLLIGFIKEFPAINVYGFNVYHKNLQIKPFWKEFPAINVYGFNVYHKNRQIKPFWKVSPDGSSKGNGVVGILEANFIDPAHAKQDFERSLLFIRLKAKPKQMIDDYWKSALDEIALKFLMSLKTNHVKLHPYNSLESEWEIYEKLMTVKVIVLRERVIRREEVEDWI